MKKNNNTSELDDLLANVEDIDFVFENDTISGTDESDESEEDDLPEDFLTMILKKMICMNQMVHRRNIPLWSVTR
mgnify:FL=1|jgi:hypothetical protein